MEMGKDLSMCMTWYSAFGIGHWALGMGLGLGMGMGMGMGIGMGRWGQGFVIQLFPGIHPFEGAP